MPEAVRFKHGSCPNCGSLGHKKQDCLERPRAVGAKFSGEFSVDGSDSPADIPPQSYESKRDHWGKFNDFSGSFEEFDLLEKSGNSDKLEDFSRVAETTNTDVSAKQAVMNARNLRMREDTAKYLVDLDADASLYNPKSRSMAEIGCVEFVKAADEIIKKIPGRNEISNPTLVEKMLKIKQVEAERVKEEKKRKLQDVYGVSLQLPENLSNPISNDSRAHSSVWGSFFDKNSKKWGYFCCQEISRSNLVCKNSR